MFYYLAGFKHSVPLNLSLNLLCFILGYTMKQKKKIISTWKKRFCIVKDCFLFYYKSEKDARALGVIVLPGYKIQIDEVASKCNKFIFKLFPTSRGRSTYLVCIFMFPQWQLPSLELLAALPHVCLLMILVCLDTSHSLLYIQDTEYCNQLSNDRRIAWNFESQ